jgi:hypothetical protein
VCVFVADPRAPPDNNVAERGRRPTATARPIGGGARSPEGSATKLTRATRFGAWRARGLPPFHARRRLIADPHA